MKYTSYSYLFPPRPENAIPGDMLGLYEKRGFVAQAKKNGTCNVMAISPERYITAMTRHRTPHKAWSANADTKKAFQNLPGNGWYVFVCELMHSKVTGIRNINYINDILVADGEYLVGSTFAARQSLFQGLFKPVGETDTHWIIDANTWVAKGRTSGFQEWFNSMSPEASGNHENEGLVLKNSLAKLAFPSSKTSNVSWLYKCRHRPFLAYDRAATEHHGEFALLNFPR